MSRFKSKEELAYDRKGGGIRGKSGLKLQHYVVDNANSGFAAEIIITMHMYNKI